MAFFSITTRSNNYAMEASDRHAATRRFALLVAGTDEASQRYRMEQVPEYATLEAAREAFATFTDDLDYRDNYRLGFDDDAASMAAYFEIADAGCCGSIDKRYVIGGRLATIGCNYGH
jgi:hypothetical protein